MNIANPKFNFYAKYRNQTLPWIGGDSNNLFLENIKNKHAELKLHGWLDRGISYTFNNDGYRCENFSDDASVMFLGCSITFGLGLPIESIYPTIVSKNLNLHCVNLAVPGSSSDTAFRHALHYIPILKPKIVVYGILVLRRIELLDNDVAHMYLPKNMESLPYVDFYKAFLTTEENIFLNEEKNRLATELICLKHNIKFVDIGLEIPSLPDKARDLLHFGIGHHNIFAKRILDLIN